MNELSQSIILWGGLAGAVTAVVALIVKIVKACKKAVTYFTDLKTNVDTLLTHDQAQYKAILRLTVMADNLPLSERIAAGKEYVELEGNGDVKAFYEQKLKPYDTIVKGA